ncbi:MAG TPA: glycoside hydrolase family 95 protein, partial [Armatimonadota bacterium]|nr:glycoside hydrolase family 95 protein [Armatimonadota bacterium]
MTRLLVLLLLSSLAVTAVAVQAAGTPPDRPGDTRLWYRRPPSGWMEALPIGGGRLGAMVFGDPVRDRLQLNEETLWDGHPRDTTNPEALQYLPRIRKLLFDGKNAEATALAPHLMGRPQGVKSYQSLGDLWTEWEHPAAAEGYRRELDLDRAVVTVEYTAGGTRFTREVFASHPDQVIVQRLAADGPGALNFRLRITRRQDARSLTEGEDRLILRGQVNDTPPGAKESLGLKFEAQVLALPESGSVRAEGDSLVVRGAKALTLLVAGATSYGGGDPAEKCRRQLRAAARKPYSRLLADHVADHRK